ncbi:dynein light chain Tctex-type 5 [Myripristis murdjan]|uniref:Dynein light chain Tctex-type family member 5 n=1 Tax=Myripristis murdjan TaxID=586833 RepID=A0A667Z2X8_9TELE|nr:tctex1 domain-containing protein 1 [Myripristis murdjan]
MTDLSKDKVRLLKKRGSVSSRGSHEVKARETAGKTKDSISTVSNIDEGHHDDSLWTAVQMESTYQLGPYKRVPFLAVQDILKDVLVSYLQEEKYDVERCRLLAKTIPEVIKARVKDLMIPRFKIIVLLYIGQLCDQSMIIGSRCLWDATNDTFASHSFKNSSLFAVANVYTVYFE